MAPLEKVLLWIAVVLYALSSALYIYSFVFDKEGMMRRMAYFIGLAFAAHTAAILARYHAVGNLPVAGDYETALNAAWFMVAFLLYMTIRHKALRPVGVFTLPVPLLVLGYGLVRVGELAPMAVTVRSPWLYIHITFAFLAFGAFTIAFGLGVAYLLKEKNLSAQRYARLPDLPRLDDLMFRYLVFGFITFGVMIASGAIWAKDLWGRFWGWDPIETWSLITWLIYAVVIHLRVTLGWKGSRLAWMVIIALPSVAISIFGIDLIVSSSLHLFRAWQDF